MRVADELIAGIVNSSGIPSGKRRREIERELRSHIEDFVASAREAGRGQDEIEQLVRANFGEPGQIAQGFAWVYRRERRMLQAFAFMLSTALVASALSAGILTMQAGLAFGLGNSIMKVLASRHTAIETLDILASVAVYLGLTSLENLFVRQRFQKAALLLAGIFIILTASCAAASLPVSFLLFGLVNGVFFRAIQQFVSRRGARLGIVMICFPLAGLAMALLRSRVSQGTLAATCASWLAMGTGYLLMSHLAARVDRALFNGLQRIHAGD